MREENNGQLSDTSEEEMVDLIMSHILENAPQLDNEFLRPTIEAILETQIEKIREETGEAIDQWAENVEEANEKQEQKGETETEADTEAEADYEADAEADAEADVEVDESAETGESLFTLTYAQEGSYITLGVVGLAGILGLSLYGRKQNKAEVDDMINEPLLV